MGAAESLSLAITTQTTGTAEVEKLVSALNKYVDKVQEAKDKSEKGPNPASWEAFAGHIKDAIQNPLQTAGNAAEGMLKTLGPLGSGLVATAGGSPAAARPGGVWSRTPHRAAQPMVSPTDRPIIAGPASPRRASRAPCATAPRRLRSCRR